jgi:HK97 family phage major capsid protein
VKNTTSTSFTELWAERSRIVADIERLAQTTAPTDQDRAEEARLVTALTAIDGQITRVAPHVDSLVQQRANDIQGLLNRGTGLSQRDHEAADWAKSAILEKNPAAYILEPDDERGFSAGYPGLEYRDVLKSTATQALGTSVFSRFQLHLVEQTPVLRAGCLQVRTDTGEDLVIPKSTAFQTAALIGEGQPITESDPTLATVTLRAYKIAAFWQLSRELVDDSPANLLDALAQGAASALAVAYGGYLATGTGSSQPQGYSAAAVGRQSPTGGATTFGAQATAGLGTDNIDYLYASVAEPYLAAESIAVLGRSSALLQAKLLKDTTNRPILDTTPVVPGASANLRGVPFYNDPHIAAMAANAKSLAFGNWARGYVVRFVRGVRLERSDEFAFSSDLVSFKAIVRMDGALLDTSALRLFQNSST